MQADNLYVMTTIFEEKVALARSPRKEHDNGLEYLRRGGALKCHSPSRMPDAYHSDMCRKRASEYLPGIRCCYKDYVGSVAHSPSNPDARQSEGDRTRPMLWPAFDGCHNIFGKKNLTD
jgi:hypothetical protein